MALMSKYGANVKFNFAAGAASSNAVDLRQALTNDGLPESAELRLVGFGIPSAWTAAKLTLLASFDDGRTFQSVYDASGTEYQMTVIAGGYCLLLPGDLVGIKQLKLQSGVTGTTVNQVSAVTVTGNTRRFE